MGNSWREDHPGTVRWRKNTSCTVLAVSIVSCRTISRAYSLNCAIIVAMHLQFIYNMNAFLFILFFQDILLGSSRLHWNANVYLFWTVFNTNFEENVSCVNFFGCPDSRLHTWATVLGGVSTPFGSRLVLPFHLLHKSLSLLWADFRGEENGFAGPLPIELPSSEEIEVSSDCILAVPCRLEIKFSFRS